MSWWRRYNPIILGRILVLLVVIGQTALLLHETGHTGNSVGHECQVCLHGQPYISVGDIEPVLADYPGHTSLIVVHPEQPVLVSPDYSNGSRAPPFS